jgi:hypothetical protein
VIPDAGWCDGISTVLASCLPLLLLTAATIDDWIGFFEIYGFYG